MKQVKLGPVVNDLIEVVPPLVDWGWVAYQKDTKNKTHLQPWCEDVVLSFSAWLKDEE